MDDVQYGGDSVLGDDFVFDLLVNYLYIQYAVQGVTLIQRQFRVYLKTKTLHHLLHKMMSIAHKYDIIEYSYAPPDRESLIPLLWYGGYHYREAERDFNRLKNI